MSSKAPTKGVVMRRKFIVIAAIAALVAGTAACGGGGDDESSPDPTTTTTDAVRTSTTDQTTSTTSGGGGSSDTTEPDPEPSTCEVSWNTAPDTEQIDSGANETLGYLTKARVGQHDCYDRVVFDFAGATGGVEARGFDIRYVDQVTQDGSGNPVPVQGDAFLQVVLYGDQPADTSVDLAAAVDQLVSGSSLREVKFAGFFEGNYTIAVGVSDKLPFRALRDAEGTTTKVIIDIAHKG